MSVKQYKNRLGVYEPYQSGGGGGGRNHNNKPHDHYYSTPNYMSFMDAMYVNKYGKINQEGGFDISRNLYHYFKTLTKWSDRLSQSGVHNEAMIVNNVDAHRKAEKALNNKINVYSANKVGGRNKLLMGGGGGGDGSVVNPRKLNHKAMANGTSKQLEPFSLIVKGSDEFKPVLFLS